jgi:hypothetical protein
MVQIICEVRAASLPVIAAEIRNIRGIPAALADDVVDYALAPAVAGVLACWFDFDNVVEPAFIFVVCNLLVEVVD